MSGYATIVLMQSDNQIQVNMLIGYCLIMLGVVVMFLACIQVYRVFTRQAQPMQYFQFEGVKIDLRSLAPQIDTSALDQLRQQLNMPQGSAERQPTPAQMTEIIPAQVLNEPANLGVFLLFMGFLLNLGYRLADLGIKLVKPIYVRANS